MKKLLSILLSVIMALSCGLATTSIAYAGTVKSPSQTETEIEIEITVNGGSTTDVDYEVDPDDPSKITFTYTGDGDFSGWNFYDKDGNLLVEGVDYEIVYDDGNGTITVIFADDITFARADADVIEEQEPTTEPEKPTEPNKKPDSPKTGAASAAGLAVAGAGAAILLALRKKSDAE